MIDFIQFLFVNLHLSIKSVIVSGSKYVLNPDLRAQRIVNISQYASVDFCKKFWFLGELGMIILKSYYAAYGTVLIWLISV